MTRLREIRAAFLAHVLAQTFVFQQVLIEKCFRRVAIVADIAYKRLGIGVLQHMRLIFGSNFEGLAARVARVRGRVAGFNVLVQHRQAGVEIVTKAAAKISSFFHMNARDMAE